MAVAAENEKGVKLRFTQGISGHRTRVIPATKETVKQRLENGALADVVVSRPEYVEVVGEFAYGPKDETVWHDPKEAKRMVDRGIAEYVN